MLIDDGFLQVPTIPAANVPTPPAGSCRLFFDSSNGNNLSQKDSAGAVIDLTDNSALASGTFTNSAVAAETVIASWPIAANTFKAGDEVFGLLSGQVSSTATLTFRIRMGTAGTTADAVVGLFTTSAAGVANQHLFMEFMLAFLSSTTAGAGGRVGFGAASFGIATAAFAAATVNLTVANFITITVVQSVAQTLTSRAGSIQRS